MIYAIFNKFGQRMYQYKTTKSYIAACDIVARAKKESPNAGYHIEKVEED